MKIVVDSNIIAALSLEMPYSEIAQSHFVTWVQQGIPLIVPMLFQYEITTIMRRHVHAKKITKDESKRLIRDILSCDIQIVNPSLILQYAALSWAEKTSQAKAYDGHYLALAEQEGAEFWSADKRLINSVRQLGVDWVHWIGER